MKKLIPILIATLYPFFIHAQSIKGVILYKSKGSGMIADAGCQVCVVNSKEFSDANLADTLSTLLRVQHSAYSKCTLVNTTGNYDLSVEPGEYIVAIQSNISFVFYKIRKIKVSSTSVDVSFNISNY